MISYAAIKKSMEEFAAKRAAESARRRYPEAKVTVDGSHIVIQHPTAARDEFGDENTVPGRWIKEAMGGR